MLGSTYTSYTAALETSNLATLVERRRKLCLDFAHSVAKNPHVCNMHAYLRKQTITMHSVQIQSTSNIQV